MRGCCGRFPRTGRWSEARRGLVRSPLRRYGARLVRDPRHPQRRRLGGGGTGSRDSREDIGDSAAPGLRNGDYTVLWRVLSDDGHTLSGVIAFGVGSGRAPPQAALSADNGPGVQSVVSRFLLFGGLLTAAGAAFFRFAVGPVTPRLLLGAFLLAFVGISGVAHDVSVSTRFGTVMVAAAVIAGVGALLAALTPRLLPAGGAGVRSGARPAACTDARRSCARPREAVARAAGGFPASGRGLGVARRPGGARACALARGSVNDERPIVRRFSKVALVSVIVLSVTGLIRALAELGGRWGRCGRRGTGGC